MLGAETHLLASPPSARSRQAAAPKAPLPAASPLVESWEPLRQANEETIAPCPRARRRAMLLMMLSAAVMSGVAYGCYQVIRLLL